MLRTALPIIAFALLATVPAAVHAAPPTLQFGGYTWQVRDYGGGPGPNTWDPANAFVDAAGLHLRITQTAAGWSAAEVVMTTALGFGTYSFEIAGRPDTLDKNVVLGLFNYPASPEVGPDGSNEIDIEFAQWGTAKTRSRLHWTVHAPVAGMPAAQQSKAVTLGDGGSTHSFHWTQKGLSFAWTKADGTKATGSWTYAPKSATRHVPQVPLVLHMNLWLFVGSPPSDGKPAEVVIRGFSFVPD